MKSTLSSIGIKFKFDFKQLFYSRTFWISTVFYFILAIIITTIFVPLWGGFGVMIGFGINIPILLAMGGNTYAWKKSSLYENQEMTKVTNISNYLATILFIFFIGNLFFAAFFLVVTVASQFNIFMASWLGTSHVNGVHWDNVYFFPAFFNIETDVLLIFAFYFCLYRFVGNIKNYYITILALSMLYIIFGAALNSYFWQYSTTSSGSALYYSFHPQAFPAIMFIPSLFFPFYGIAQQQALFFGLTLTNVQVQESGMQALTTIVPAFVTTKSWQWTAVMLQPFAMIGIFAAIGMISSRFKKAK